MCNDFPHLIASILTLDMWIVFLSTIVLIVVPGFIAFVIYEATGECFNTTVLIGLFIIIGMFVLVLS